MITFFEAARDKSLVAHKRFLDFLLKEDFMLGTHQGPMLTSVPDVCQPQTQWVRMGGYQTGPLDSLFGSPC